jgi:hypothetical protein
MSGAENLAYQVETRSDSLSDNSDLISQNCLDELRQSEQLPPVEFDSLLEKARTLARHESDAETWAGSECLRMVLDPNLSACQEVGKEVTGRIFVDPNSVSLELKPRGVVAYHQYQGRRFTYKITPDPDGGINTFKGLDTQRNPYGQTTAKLVPADEPEAKRIASLIHQQVAQPAA